MEASQAGLAAGDAPAEGQQQQGEQEAQQQQQPDISQLLETVGSMPQQLQEMRAWMEENAAQQQPQEQQEPAEPEPADLSFIDPASDSYDPQAASQQLLGILDQQTQQAIQSAVEPLQQEVRDLHAAREAEALAAQFPELENQETADAVLRTTAEWVQAAGLPPEAASNMQVVKAVYMMGRAAELAGQESDQEGQQQAAALEGAGGASPGGTAAGGLTAESIVGAGPRNPLPFP